MSNLTSAKIALAMLTFSAMVTARREFVSFLGAMGSGVRCHALSGARRWFASIALAFSCR